MAAFAVTYLALCFAGGIGFVEMSLHLQKRRLSPAHVAMANERVRGLGAVLTDVQITSQEGLALRGWFVRPAQSNGATVLLLHGLTDNRLGVGGYAELFLKHGYSVLLADSRTHGESDGTIATYGLLEGDDVRRWVDWLETTQKPKCVYGFGTSMGAGILLQSLKTEKRFCAVAAESPFADFREAVYDRIGERFHTGPWLGKTLLRPTVEVGLLYAHVRYGLDFTQSSPRDAVAGSSVPVLLIHGQEDSVLRVENSEMIQRASPRTVLWEVPGAEHCGAWSADPQRFEREVLGFIARARA
jgi:uncharacterized protein